MNKEKQINDLNENTPPESKSIDGNSKPFENYVVPSWKIFNILDIITFISLSIVVFGIFSLGFLVAPVVFKNPIPRELSSEIMSNIFLRYYPFAFTCILITVGSELTRFFLKTSLLRSKKWLVQYLIILVVAFMTGYSNYILLPKINALRLQHNGPTLWTHKEFITLHKRSEDYAKAMFLLGLIPLCLMVTKKVTGEG